MKTDNTINKVEAFLSFPVSLRVIEQEWVFLDYQNDRTNRTHHSYFRSLGRDLLPCCAREFYCGFFTNLGDISLI